MNLIENNKPISSIVNFRPEQHKLIPQLLTYGINYLIDLGLPYDPNCYALDGSKIEYIEDTNYSNYNHFSCFHIKIRLFPKVQLFTCFGIPNLINNTFFKLNGSYYIPKLYISDEPCVIKENSSLFYSLFSPLSMYFEDKRFTFIGINFKLNEFLSILIDEDWEPDLIDSICDRWDLIKEDLICKNKTIEYFSEKLNIEKDIDLIRNKMNQLFFDPWTKELYKEYYKIDNPTLSSILKYTIKRIINEEKPSFIDLHFKRLVWIEYILKPYFKAIGIAAIILLKKNNLRVLKMNINEIVNHFFSQDGLNGNEFYNTANGFSGLGLYKASLMNPFGTGNPPSEISSIHPSYKGKICPNSVSNKDTGKEVFLVPDQYIDPKFGIFKFD